MNRSGDGPDRGWFSVFRSKFFRAGSLVMGFGLMAGGPLSWGFEMASSVDSTISFATLQDAKLHLNLDPEGTIDREGVLVAIINHTAQQLEAYCDRKLKERAYSSLLVDGTGTDILAAPHFPIDKGQTLEVYVDESRAFASSSQLVMLLDDGSNSATATVLLDEETGEFQRIDGSVFPELSRCVKLVMTAGIPLADAGGLVQAQLIQISAIWCGGGRDPNVAASNIAGISKTLRTDRESVLVPDAARAADPWKERTIFS